MAGNGRELRKKYYMFPPVKSSSGGGGGVGVSWGWNGLAGGGYIPLTSIICITEFDSSNRVFNFCFEIVFILNLKLARVDCRDQKDESDFLPTTTKPYEPAP